MSGSGWIWDPGEFPNLTIQNNKKTSEQKRRYNCIGWAAGSKTQFWWPDPIAVASKKAYWPKGAPIDCTIEAFVLAFATRRYVECPDDTLEPGFEKIAIYEAPDPDDNWKVKPTHAARQLPDGSWTSKIGRNVDIQHATPEAVGGGLYGTIARYMKRPIGLFRRRSRRH